jgi:hypothetical protein
MACCIHYSLWLTYSDSHVVVVDDVCCCVVVLLYLYLTVSIGYTMVLIDCRAIREKPKSNTNLDRPSRARERGGASATASLLCGAAV